MSAPCSYHNSHINMLFPIAEYEIFGEVSSSSDEDELKDVNIMDSGEDEGGLSRVDTHESFMSADFSTQMTDMSLDGDTCKCRHHRSEASL